MISRHMVLISPLYLIALAGALAGCSRQTAAAPSAAPAGPPSYEDTVRNQQKRWGHGRTLDNPMPTARPR
jgi:hypothetical protein